ncbi:hypothetical protein GQ600_2349 [Phytophthora cactorum]|nr:hypothetical protein GQ600_2349 [Phytophthora cactorum]
MRDPPLIAETNPTGRYGDEYAYAVYKDNGRPSQEPEDMVRRKCSLAWGELLMEGSRTRSDDSASCTSSPSNGNNSSIESRAVDKAGTYYPNTAQRTRCARYTSSRAPSPRRPRQHLLRSIPFRWRSPPASIRRREAVEFLRVLNDFKRCLRPPSSCSSSVLLSTTSASTSSKYEAPMVTETANRDPGQRAGLTQTCRRKGLAHLLETCRMQRPSGAASGKLLVFSSATELHHVHPFSFESRAGNTKQHRVGDVVASGLHQRPILSQFTLYRQHCHSVT